MAGGVKSFSKSLQPASTPIAVANGINKSIQRDRRVNQRPRATTPIAGKTARAREVFDSKPNPSASPADIVHGHWVAADQERNHKYRPARINASEGTSPSTWRPSNNRLTPSMAGTASTVSVANSPILGPKMKLAMASRLTTARNAKGNMPRRPWTTPNPNSLKLAATASTSMGPLVI